MLGGCLTFAACGPQTPTKAGEKGSNIAKDRVAIWESPSEDSKAITTINAGEKVEVTGTQSVQLRGKQVQFSKVRTSDKKEGFIRSSLLAIGAYTVIADDVQLFKRNNTASGPGHNAALLRPGVVLFVEETEPKSKWIKVNGHVGKASLSGWIQSDIGLSRGLGQPETESKSNSVPVDANTVTITAIGGLRLRKSAPDGEVLVNIPQGDNASFKSSGSERLVVGNRAGTWAAVAYQDKEGVAFSGFLESAATKAAYAKAAARVTQLECFGYVFPGKSGALSDTGKDVTDDSAPAIKIKGRTFEPGGVLLLAKVDGEPSEKVGFIGVAGLKSGEVMRCE